MPSKRPEQSPSSPMLSCRSAITSAATFIETILSGSCTGSPRLILSTLSMPSMTWPQTVYWRLRKPASSKQMKNCELAEFGFCDARHRAGAAGVVHVGELGLEVRLVGAAHAGAGRVEVLAAALAELHVAGLRHEAVDDAVEHDAVIGAFARQFLDAARHGRAPGRAAAR